MSLHIELTVREPLPAEPESHFLLLHLTGGLVARLFPEGWTLEPIPYSDQPHLVGFVPHKELSTLLGGRGVRPIFYEQNSVTNGTAGSLIRPWSADPKTSPMHAKDLWSSIARHTRQTDPVISEKAKHVSLGLININTHIGRIARFIREQLYVAIRTKKREGHGFSNLGDLEISASMHDFYASLGTARDHISAVVALRIGKSKKYDDMTKLLKLLNADSSVDDAMLNSLIDGNYVERKENNWALGSGLSQISSMRRRLVHHEPYGSLEEEEFGRIENVISDRELSIVKYKRSLRESCGLAVDLMDRVRHDYLHIMDFAEDMAKASGYPLGMINLTDKDVLSFEIK